ncbi:putative anion transporter 6 [Hibiscus syriacus]|uniref:Anion transporter 6 n=1 Tax=Hibiscus syriacus TaxID=106335 RepID=A0A6A3A8G8_HIBSY|nr:putative anion transporter 6 [Hibiscus syriacus]
MAKFTIRLDNFCFLPHNASASQSSIFLGRTSRKNLHLELIPSKHRLNFKVLCRIKEKENVKDEREKVGACSGGLVNGVRVEELDKNAGLGMENASREAGFDLVWPPWKNIPQRYKLIVKLLHRTPCRTLGTFVNLSVAIIPMSHQFGWNSSVSGLVQSSIFWGYALSQSPGGWLSKLFGGRKVLKIGVLAWSLATAIVPVLAVFLFLLDSCLDYSCLGFWYVGIGEGVSPSAATDLIARSIPLEEWSRAVSFVFGGLSVGSVTGEELDLNLREAAWVSILPPLASIFVTSIAAQFADNLIANGVETTTMRKICQAISLLSPATCMILSSLDLGLKPWEIVGILCCGLSLSSFALSGLYCTHQDISPEYASILLSITNTVGAVPGIVGVALTGFLLDSTHSWGVPLFAPSIFFYLTGTIVWLAFASSKPQNFTESD